MIDIHCHIVPGVDDGAPDIATALAMIEQAASAGVRGILTTPHIIGRPDEIERHAAHVRAFGTLLEAASGMALYLGGEVRVSSEAVETIPMKEFTTSEQGKYILLEMPSQEVPVYFSSLLFEYRLNGIRPIVAHPERNLGVIKRPELALEFVKQGALLQVTTSSINGEIGETFQKLSHQLLLSGLVSIIASDAHNLTTRSFSSWRKTLDVLTELDTWSVRERGQKSFLIDTLSTVNPGAVVAGSQLPYIELDPEGESAVLERLNSFQKTETVKRKRKFFF